MMERVAQARLWWRDNSLAVSFIISASYSAFKIVLAILLSSWWLGALGAYYLIVASIRLYMLRSRQNGWIVYRRTGWLLVLLNLSVAIVITDVAWLGQGFHYPGYTIYAMASWTFYQLTVAIINLVRLRRSTDPVIRAVKDMRMCVVLVSIFTLQNAMLSLARSIPVCFWNSPMTYLVRASSMSDPPSWVSPDVDRTSKTPSLKSMMVTSRVPPPRSKTMIFCSTSDLSSP